MDLKHAVQSILREENVDDSIKDDEINEAIKLSHCRHFINQLPALDTNKILSRNNSYNMEPVILGKSAAYISLVKQEMINCLLDHKEIKPTEIASTILSNKIGRVSLL